MKKTIAALVSGLILGSAGVAAASGYWTESFAGYTCEGVSSGARCIDKRGQYRVAILPSGITIYTGGGNNPNPIMWCDRYGSPSRACTSVVG